MMMLESVFKDERGSTTAGMAVALLVALSLLFSSAQIYRVHSACAEVQEVADAAALAAENPVAEFMVAVRVADAAVLSLTLLGDVAYGAGVVTLCVPPAAELGAQLISAGQKILQARDAFSERACEGLEALQRALPFLAAANAAAVAASNGRSAGEYAALALLLPGEGAPIGTGASAAEDAMEEAVESGKDELAEAASRAEEAARAAEEAKARGFARDCGDNPSYCLYERAAHLAGLEGGDNPLYTSVDSWSFSVPLERARAYYRERLLGERPASDSAKDQARCVLRKQFYAHAIRELREAYVHETADSFSASFPRFPRNTEQMRATRLYTEPAYPVTIEDELPVMHAWDGCPEAGLVDYYGSVRTLESGVFETCSACGFTAEALGAVASASTAIDNGFEYHYDAIAQAAADYQKAWADKAPLNRAAKRGAQDLLDKVLKALGEAKNFRITADPPGAAGCIVLTLALGEGNPGAFESAFAPTGALGTRAAVSASTLLRDEDEDASVVADLLDGLAAEGASVAGVGGVVLDGWDAMLDAYGQGAEGLASGLESLLAGVPLVGPTGLGDWAADTFRAGLETVGLDPADTAPLKPVLASTEAVARAGGGEYASRYLALRSQALADPTSSGDVLGLLADRVSDEAYRRLSEAEVTIAVIDIPLTGTSIPLTITLPPAVAEGAAGLVDRAFDALRAATGESQSLQRWE
ncbi:molybdenum cofactor biosynthesis enzyme [Adlercreutzia sp. R25]|uniref:molybdenum cofactor biosynthesis enzyme n=1 Tax=Adlercreutzia shanghongiae TaxID=3111773 RepID=UPI002DBB78DB|nr:molybdenum cofactor biosynthesis enzyme [Adlercreutzia sp. R25]MEC4273140.1 molybdenum cofactor biosynthesis enzyme [Adlercreutzia sp. R25]